MAKETVDPNTPLREYAYTIQLFCDSWAGTYGVGSPFVGKAGSSGDGGAVKTGAGREGRITGGLINARGDAEARTLIRDLYGAEHRILSLEPRQVVDL